MKYRLTSFVCTAALLAISLPPAAVLAADEKKAAKSAKPAKPVDEAKPTTPPTTQEPPTPAKFKPEPHCLVIEPAVLKTSAARALGGSKETVLSPAEQTPDGLRILNADAFAAKGLSWEEFSAKALIVSTNLLKGLTPSVSKDKNGVALYAKVESDSPLTSSCVLCPEFAARFERELGKELLVLVPDRFTIYVFPRRGGEFQKLGPEIAKQFVASVYPASAEAFEITASGLKPVARLETGE
jgi:hypothetical protein